MGQGVVRSFEELRARINTFETLVVFCANGWDLRDVLTLKKKDEASSPSE